MRNTILENNVNFKKAMTTAIGYISICKGMLKPKEERENKENEKEKGSRRTQRQVTIKCQTIIIF